MGDATYDVKNDKGSGASGVEAPEQGNGATA
jgi:hypothetical protein